MDAGTKAAIAEQLQLGEQLKRKIEGRRSGSDDDSSDGGYSTDARWGGWACVRVLLWACSSCCLLHAVCMHVWAEYMLPRGLRQMLEVGRSMCTVTILAASSPMQGSQPIQGPATVPLLHRVHAARQLHVPATAAMTLLTLTCCLAAVSLMERARRGMGAARPRPRRWRSYKVSRALTAALLLRPQVADARTAVHAVPSGTQKHLRLKVPRHASDPRVFAGVPKHTCCCLDLLPACLVRQAGAGSSEHLYPLLICTPAHL
jgi:hypothetical protein